MEVSEYDFIIVGGGTAGLVVANRLTEHAGTTVMVLEAGTSKLDDPRMTTPGLASAMYNNDDFDWKFKSVPQPGLDGKTIIYPRGKTVGGSSAINALGLVYPSKSCLDGWERLGNRGWTWDRLAPYYRKFQTFNAPSNESQDALGIDYINQSIQGHSGPIHSSYPTFVGPFVEAWPRTLKNLGWSITGDPMTGESIGGFNTPYAVNPDGCVRSHAGNEYYAPVAGRHNLQLRTRAFVEKISLTRRDGQVKADGVYAVMDGDKRLFTARKEVILAAGAFQTPQILELSGIGSCEVLSKYGIDVVVENHNVGENLQDHAMSGICAEVKEGVPTGDLRRDPSFLAKAREMYDTQRTGPLTAGFPSVAFLPLSGWGDDNHIGDILRKSLTMDQPYDLRTSRGDQFNQLCDIILSPHEASVQLCLGASQVHFDKSAYGEAFAVTEPENFISILAMHPHPFSAGTVHICSADAKVPPTIDPRFMTHPMDPEIFGRHLVAVDKLLITDPLKDLLKPDGRRLPEGSPLFDKKLMSTPEGRLQAGREHARRYVRSTSHPAGTAAMLPLEKGGVVDIELMVYGVTGLRIVDASVFPMVPRGYIQSTVYAVAELASDMIKETWSLH